MPNYRAVLSLSLSIVTVMQVTVAQVQVPAVAVRAPLDFNTIARPAVPADTMELVVSTAQPVADAAQRIAAIGLLNKAHELSNVRAQPYDLQTSFTALGSVASDGNWLLEDISPGRGSYLWKAQGPNYSAVNFYPDATANGLYGNQPSGLLPLRLMQVRSAIFFQYPNPGPQASIRTAAANLDGAQQNCVLVVIGAGKRTFAGSRNWEEAEYCMNAQTGLLSSYSPAPGLFVRYDYSTAIRFHNKAIPTGFTIWEAGKKVAEAKTTSVTDPPASTDPMFSTAGLVALGAGREMNPGVNSTLMTLAPGKRYPTSNADASMQMVTLHGNVSGDGKWSEVAILASSDAALNQAALDQAQHVGQSVSRRQPGATAQSSELILTVQFISSNK